MYDSPDVVVDCSKAQMPCRIMIIISRGSPLFFGSHISVLVSFFKNSCRTSIYSYGIDTTVCGFKDA